MGFDPDDFRDTRDRDRERQREQDRADRQRMREQQRREQVEEPSLRIEILTLKLEI